MPHWKSYEQAAPPLPGAGGSGGGFGVGTGFGVGEGFGVGVLSQVQSAGGHHAGTLLQFELHHASDTPDPGTAWQFSPETTLAVRSNRAVRIMTDW